MNNEQWQSIIRTVLTLLIGPGSYLVLKGILTSDQSAQLIPILVPIIMTVGGLAIGKWGVGTHSASSVVAAVNSASVPGVKAVAATSPSTAVSVDPRSGKITPITLSVVLVTLAALALMGSGGHAMAGLCSPPGCVCATNASAQACQKGKPSQSIQQFTVADIQAAIADATAHNDTRHGKCWTALLPIAQEWQSPIHPPTAPGLAELAQTFFDAQNALNQPLVPDSVIEACSETVYDLKIDFAKLAALVGVQVVAPMLPVLP